MRKIIVGIVFFMTLTLSATLLAEAQVEAQHVWKQNTITNRTNETIYVVWSTAYPAFGSVPVAGYRTSGWSDIPPGQQRSYWAFSTHRIYFLILKGGDPIKPTTSTRTYLTWINRNAHFNIVMEKEINVFSDINYRNTNFGDLIPYNGFLQYSNGSPINVTNTWVEVYSTPEETRDDTTDAPVNIPDRILHYSIEWELHKATGRELGGAEITQADMLALTSLTVKPARRDFGTYVYDLTGIEFATNLTELNLVEIIETPDLSLLGALTNLKKLNISGNYVLNLSGLRGLTNLTELDASGTSRPLNLLPLRGLTNLKNLNLGSTGISDVSPLSELTNLTTLHLPGNNISDFSPLRALTNLTTLHIGGNNISDFSPLRALTNLTKLHIGGSNISDLSPLRTLTNLTTLHLPGNNIADLSPLRTLTNLTELYLSRSNISDLSPLRTLTNLTTLHLSDNNISDLSPLRALTNLTTLHLSDNNISDLLPLRALTNLTKLYLGNNQISHIFPLQRLRKLELLSISSNPILDLSSLLLLPNLNFLAIEGGPFQGRELREFLSNNDTCNFDMPRAYGRLQPSTHVYSISKKPSPGGVSGNESVIKAAPLVHENATVNWTYETTVASESESDPTTITIKFLNGTKDHKDIVIEAARTWESFGYLHFKFIHPGQSGASDIRVKFEYDYFREVKTETKIVNGVEKIEYTPTGKTFNNTNRFSYQPPSEKHGLLSYSKYWSAYGTLANNDEYKHQETMFFTTDFNRGTALHELGHALGLAHEHLSPKFKDYFEWVDIESVYTHFQSGNSSWTREDVAHNVLNTVPVATNLPGVDFDRESVMTYGIPAKLIKARPNAPAWAKSAATGGIGNNSDLSTGDEKIMAVLYPKPRDFVVSGKITVHATDDDFGADDEYDDRDNPRLFQFKHTHHSPLVKYIDRDFYVYTWGNKECRVEVHLVVRNFINNGLELGVYALLYEDRAGTRGGSDLEDVVCKTVRVPLYNSRTVKLDRLENRSLLELRLLDKRCADLYSHGKIFLGDALGGGDWADVTVTFEVEDPIVATSFAPSIPVGSITSFSETTRRELFSDVNADGRVDVADLILISNMIGQSAFGDSHLDVNRDGIITIADLVYAAQHLGHSRVAAAPTHVVVPEGLAYKTVQGWIESARGEDDGTTAFREGSANLEYLLTLIIPEETALLHNYPNPFNPETWIPYHLSQPADVALTIYAIDGKVMRHLDLGHQAAGYYQSKSRAAYWDGRNAIGERVASGLYFYTFTAGEFAATRKMLILK